MKADERQRNHSKLDLLLAYKVWSCSASMMMEMKGWLGCSLSFFYTEILLLVIFKDDFKPIKFVTFIWEKYKRFMKKWGL